MYVVAGGTKTEALAWVLGIGLGLWLLFRFPKQMGLTALGLAVLAAGVIGYFWLQGIQTERERASITTAASAADGLCKDPDYPVWVSFRNGSAKTVERVSFMLQGRRPQRSDAVFDNYRYSDFIMKPDTGAAACFAVDSYGKNPDEALQDLEWTASVLSVSFR